MALPSFSRFILVGKMIVQRLSSIASSGIDPNGVDGLRAVVAAELVCRCGGDVEVRVEALGHEGGRDPMRKRDEGVAGEAQVFLGVRNSARPTSPLFNLGRQSLKALEVAAST